MKYQNVVPVRFSDEQVAKLDCLAKTTRRGRANIIRLLVELAQASEAPDIQLADGIKRASQRQPHTDRNGF